MSEALIQIVDENDQPVGQASIDEAQTQGLIHRISSVMVENGAGQVLLQFRNANKETFPSCWDNSAAGHVDVGESYEIAAKREMAEEIGVQNVEVEEIGYYHTNSTFGERRLNRFEKAYRTVVDPNTTFRLQADEVSKVAWFDIEELKVQVVEHPEKFASGLIETVQRFYK